MTDSKVDLDGNRAYNTPQQILKGHRLTETMAKRALTPTYIFFFLLFWPDTWRILIGLVIGGVVAPRLSGADDTAITTAMLFVMPAAIGYAASARPAQFISAQLRRLILNKR